MKIKILFLLASFVFVTSALRSQTEGQIMNPNPGQELKHAVDVSPLSPFIDIYGVHYIYRFSPKDELITGLSYMNIHYDFGYTNSPALIIGYRRYLWKNLHVEYELWPCYDEFYESYEQKYYQSFDLWNEFRIGYRFDFKVAERSFYLNLQWPFGFGLYAGNKPEKFMDQQEKERFFYFPPLFFVGMRF